MGEDDNRSNLEKNISMTSLSTLGDKEKEKEAQEPQEHIKYPKQVAFIVGNEFCERFSYYGMKAVLSLYFTTQLNWDEDTATVIYHTFNCLCYFTPLLGAIVADSWLGRFRTIFYVSILYACGNVMLAIGSIGFNGEVVISMIGLGLIAFGTGGIKPCVSAFGGDQFILPQQQEQLVQFFSVFYFSINGGSFLSTIITPILRSDVTCFDHETCFFAAFGIPAILFIVAIILFVVGKPMYRMVPPDGENLIVKFVHAVGVALMGKFRNRKSSEKKDHWMDYAEDKFGKSFIEDVKAVLRVLFLYIPLPIYFTLYDQTGSRWTFQCTRMNGQMGSVTLKPDQMTAVNAILILLFIPLFDKVVYPLLAKCNILTKPLPRMAVGGILYAVAFVVSGILELSLEDTYAKLPSSGESHLNVINGVGCTTSLSISQNNINNELKAFTEASYTDLKPESIKITVEVSKCEGSFQPDTSSAELSLTLKSAVASSVLVFVDPYNGNKLSVKQTADNEKEKNSEGLGNGRVIYNLGPDVRKACNEIFFDADHKRDKGDETFEIESDTGFGTTPYRTLEPYENDIKVCEAKGDTRIKFEMGGVYNVLVQQLSTSGPVSVTNIEITPASSYHILLVVPQYTVLTAGEILFSITGLEFSFSQAPPQMKSILQAAWLMCTALGNILVIIIGTANFFSSQAYEFFLFAGIQVADVALFIVLAYFYVPYDPSKRMSEEEQKEYHKEHEKEIMDFIE